MYFVQTNSGIKEINEENYPLLYNYIEENKDIIIKEVKDNAHINKYIKEHYLPDNDFILIKKEIKDDDPNKYRIDIILEDNNIAFTIFKLF